MEVIGAEAQSPSLPGGLKRRLRALLQDPCPSLYRPSQVPQAVRFEGLLMSILQTCPFPESLQIPGEPTVCGIRRPCLVLVSHEKPKGTILLLLGENPPT